MILLNITDTCSNCEEACIHVTSGRSTDCCVCSGIDLCTECDNRRVNEAERLYERMLGDFYGGEHVTLGEQMGEARKRK